MKNKLKTFGFEDVLIYRVDKLHRIDCITRLCKIYAPKTEGDWKLEFESDISLQELQCIIDVLKKLEKI